MHDAAPASHDAPPPPPVNDQHHHHHQDAPIHIPPHEHLPHHTHPPSDEPPPTYDEAIGSGAAPPPGYGTFRPYADESSIASSEVESTDRALPEWFGQFLVVFVFLCLIYGFYEFITTPDDTPNYYWPGVPGNGTNPSRLYKI